MHIPDGYLGPSTCGVLFAAMLPIWAVASRIVKKSLSAKRLPLLAVGAAFCFVVMLFNIPLPGGSTGHATGAVLVAILLGPWAAAIAVSVALAVQALLFGDGGITAFGANCFNMAVVMPLGGYGVYRLLAGKAPPDSSRRTFAAGVAGYVGINLAALCAGIEFGLQPHLCRGPDGAALYCPYGLRTAVAAMSGSHLLVFGWIEALVTALVVKSLARHAPEMMHGKDNATVGASRKAWGAIGLLILLSPLGILLPLFFNAGGAWGEWDAAGLQKAVGFIPRGFANLSEIWSAPLPGYAFGSGETTLASKSFAYAVSAVAGTALVAILIRLITKRKSAATHEK